MRMAMMTMARTQVGDDARMREGASGHRQVARLGQAAGARPRGWEPADGGDAASLPGMGYIPMTPPSTPNVAMPPLPGNGGAAVSLPGGGHPMTTPGSQGR